MIKQLFTSKKPQNTLNLSFDEAGLLYTPKGLLGENEAVEWIQQANQFSTWEAVTYLQQLVNEGIVPALDNAVLIPWDELYAIINDVEHLYSIHLLALPDFIALKPSLNSKGSLSDKDFQVVLSWIDRNGRPFHSSQPRLGGVVFAGDTTKLLPFELWKLAEAISLFSLREDRSPQANERAWGELRKIAQEAESQFDTFLSKTIILSVDKLDLDMRKVDVQGSLVVELLPYVEGIDHDRWLSTFDQYTNVQGHYDFAMDDGERVRVIPDDNVIAVLKEIKRLPGRRVSGRRAKAFLRNPYAVLGDSVSRVVSPERYESLQQEAGIIFCDFDINVLRDERGRIISAELMITPEDDSGAIHEPAPFNDREDLTKFARELKKAITQEMPSFEWRKNELEIRGDSTEKLLKISGVLADRWINEKPLINAEEVLDLKRYAERIIGIDIYQPVYSPHFKKKDQGADWVPDNIDPIISWIPPGESRPAHIKISKSELKTLREKVLAAETSGEETLRMPDWPHPIDLDNARDILSAFKPLLEDELPDNLDQTDNSVASSDTKGSSDSEKVKVKHTLLIAENILETDYAEERGRILTFDNKTKPQLPSALMPDISLKDHQYEGIAWLQHLYRLMPHVHGCILADDMGLGKTLQLLAFIHWHFENQKNADPVIIVAPVSLLDNWQNEISKFFKKDALKTLLLYGNNLSNAKVKRREIDDALVDIGITKLLRPDWLGEADIVLTTYETLRDLEFSFGAVRWGIMVCDEAQRIKSPNALVTRAAKKQNVQFRIACTGTPVENSLTDLWCLFDFVQPGLLGALNEFSHTYRKPIEAETDEQKDSIERLRLLIEPQVLRRMKHDVADLPPKIIDNQCRQLGISQKQVSMYLVAVDKYKKARGQQEQCKGNAAFLSMLHSLRMICADPTEPSLHAGGSLPLIKYSRISPKMAWLIDQLKVIQKRREKVIIFSEFREIQRLIQHYAQQEFGINMSIVNGDTSAQAPASGINRQGIIDAFQKREGFNVIILSTTAIGFGVNIQAANHVIHFTRSWNPAKEDQATDRAYRIGQEKEVSVYYPTITSEGFITFEQKLDMLLETKRRLAGDMLNGYDDLNMYDWEGLSTPGGSSIFDDNPFTSDMLRSIKPKAFEHLCVVLWAKQGYSAYITPSSGDNGVDVVAIKGNQGFLIQCKTSINAKKSLGWDAVKEVIAGESFYQQQHTNVSFKKIAATNARFNKQAKTNADLNQVELYEFNKLSALLDQFPIKLGDITVN